MAENRHWIAAAAVAIVAVLLSAGTTSATETTSSKGRVLFVSHFDVSTEMNIMLEVADALSRRRYECAFLSWEHVRCPPITHAPLFCQACVAGREGEGEIKNK